MKSAIISIFAFLFFPFWCCLKMAALDDKIWAEPKEDRHE